jgi:hypothetical protein
MSLPRRLELLQAAEQAQALTIEDDYDGEFYFGNSPRPALHGVDANGRVLYVGTFSKSLFLQMEDFGIFPRSAMLSDRRDRTPPDGKTLCCCQSNGGPIGGTRVLNRSRPGTKARKMTRFLPETLKWSEQIWRTACGSMAP